MRLAQWQTSCAKNSQVLCRPSVRHAQSCAMTCQHQIVAVVQRVVSGMLPRLSAQLLSEQGVMMLREYQQRTIDQLYAWFEAGGLGNPCLVVPTGSGQRHIVAALC